MQSCGRKSARSHGLGILWVNHKTWTLILTQLAIWPWVSHVTCLCLWTVSSSSLVPDTCDSWHFKTQYLETDNYMWNWNALLKHQNSFKVSKLSNEKLEHRSCEFQQTERTNPTCFSWKREVLLSRSNYRVIISNLLSQKAASCSCKRC